MCDEYILKRIDMMFAGKKIPIFLQSFCWGRNEILFFQYHMHLQAAENKINFMKEILHNIFISAMGIYNVTLARSVS